MEQVNAVGNFSQVTKRRRLQKAAKSNAGTFLPGAERRTNFSINSFVQNLTA